jgi:hypothetical protein
MVKDSRSKKTTEEKKAEAREYWKKYSAEGRVKERTEEQKTRKRKYLREYMKKIRAKNSVNRSYSMPPSTLPFPPPVFNPPFPPPDYPPPPPPPSDEEQVIHTLSSMHDRPIIGEQDAVSILTNMNNGHNDEIDKAASALTRIRTEKGGNRRKSNKNKSKKNRKSKRNKK